MNAFWKDAHHILKITVALFVVILAFTFFFADSYHMELYTQGVIVLGVGVLLWRLDRIEQILKDQKSADKEEEKE